MAGLLVSVRSAEEAEAAVEGGAAVIDVKEPARGPLGRADEATWRAVRRAVPSEIPVSVALGELVEWRGRRAPPPEAFAGIAFRKVGLAGAGPGWASEWKTLRDAWGGPSGWVAVVYADWRAAGSPEPAAIIAEAEEAGCAGVLVDTWNKQVPANWGDCSWLDLLRGVNAFGGLVALAGGLDEATIERLRRLGPDLFAVRGAACLGGDRGARVDAGRVRRLALSCVK